MTSPNTSDFDYELPDACIAQTPPVERDGGRLLWLGRHVGAPRHQCIKDISTLLPPRSLLVVNDSKVIPARVIARRATGGKVEILLIERLGTGRWRAMVRASKRPAVGERLEVDGGGVVEVLTSIERGRAEVALSSDELPWLSGAMPLPPYIQRPATAEDAERYQTVYAREDGSVAAPTAGLHFTPELLDEVRLAGHDVARITLHVGPGTFVPVRTENPDEHQMEEERYEISEEAARAITAAKRSGRPVVAVGTTVVRTLESSGGDPGAGRTRLFIRPGYSFDIVDALLTNFHLPQSTLLMLVSAFAGRERVIAAYEEAIRSGYRFYSYGDAMLITAGGAHD